MTEKLELAPRLNVGETPTSYASRLAIAHGVRAVEICGDFGIRYADLIEGTSVAIGKLAELGGVDFEQLSRGAFVLDHGFQYRHRGEVLVRDCLRRRRIDACPWCLLEDVRGAERDPEVAVFHRAEWCLDVVDTCPVHGVALVMIDAGADDRLRYDFANLVAPKIGRLPTMADRAKLREQTELQKYVLGRLYGLTPHVPFLDQTDLHVAIRTCEMLGTAALFGCKAQFEKLAPEARRNARIRGFEIASGGRDGVHELLHEMWYASLRRRNIDQGSFGRQAFGAIHYFLRTRPDRPVPKDEAFTLLRKVVGDFMRENFPLGPGDTVFGQPVERRTIHSVRTLSVETGLNPRRLLKVLHAEGVISKTQVGLSDHNITFDADLGRNAADKQADMLPHDAAAKYLGITRHQLVALIKAGFIGVAGAEKPLAMRIFVAREKLDELAAKLVQDIPTVARKRPGQLSIVEAADRASCPQVAIVELLLQRKLKSVARLGRGLPYNSILVDAAEVRSIIRPADPNAMSIEQYAKRYGMKTDTARALVRHGHVRGAPGDRARGQHGQILIEVPEADAFRKRYVSLGELQRDSGRGYRAIKGDLASRGVLPALDPEQVDGNFFDRDAVASVLELE